MDKSVFQKAREALSTLESEAHSLGMRSEYRHQLAANIRAGLDCAEFSTTPGNGESVTPDFDYDHPTYCGIIEKIADATHRLLTAAGHDAETALDMDEALEANIYKNIDMVAIELEGTNSGNGEWKPYYEYPEIGKPVLGYHPDWVDEDFCADGIRECFTFGDGSEWQSAKWDGYSDLWVVEDGAPTFWTSRPQPPIAQEGM